MMGNEPSVPRSDNHLKTKAGQAMPIVWPFDLWAYRNQVDAI
jgi:hypothetical protein